jgi:diguanylate cyclase (GGDEF)-like protein
MGRLAGTLYLIGSAMTVLGLLLPHSPEVDLAGFWWIAAGTAAAGALLFGYARRLPAWAYQWVMLLASATITLSLYFNGERHGGASAGNQVLYIWVALYSGYFFTRSRTIVQLGAIGALYAAVLLVVHAGPVASTRWEITVGMVAAAAGIVNSLRSRNDRLLERLTLAARTDPLTGLLNRQAFDECLERELARSRRTGRPVALLYGDIDCFKQINDQHGHEIGDAALRAVARIAGETTRDVDAVARVGGDEFAAILPDTDVESAVGVAERIRQAIIGGPALGGATVTLSFGVVDANTSGYTAPVLSRSADQALYEAKRRGRNQTVAGGVADLAFGSAGTERSSRPSGSASVRPV